MRKDALKIITLVLFLWAVAGCSKQAAVNANPEIKGGTMVSDKIENAQKYNGLGKRIAQGLALLKDPAVLNAAKGRYMVDGDNLYYSTDEYDSKPEDQGRIEAHRKYIDIQYVISGREWIGCRALEGLKLETPYNPDKDIEFYHRAEPITHIDMQAGTFAIIWPHEGHMPGRMFDKPEHVKKIVIKIKAE
jgi:biofilm protein TabA